MSITLIIERLQDHIDEEGLDILKELSKAVLPYDPDSLLEKISGVVLSGEENPDYLHDLVDKLHTSTARYGRPEPEHARSFKTDLKRYFHGLHFFVDAGEFGPLAEYLQMYHDIFSEPKAICGSIHRTCQNRDCLVSYNDPERIICSECGVYRGLCKNSPKENGRCHLHGGNARSGPLMDQTKQPGRAALYRQSLNGDLERMFVEAISDKNYLSVAPEMAVLASRTSQLMTEIGDVDYLAVQAQVQQLSRKLRQSILEEEYYDAESYAADIERLLSEVVGDKRRWDEIASLTGRLGRLAESERKRLIEEQKMITVQEMYLIQQETLMQIRDMASVVAAELVASIRSGELFKQNEIRNLILTTLHKATKGELNTSRYLLDGGEDEEAIIEGEFDSE